MLTPSGWVGPGHLDGGEDPEDGPRALARPSPNTLSGHVRDAPAAIGLAPITPLGQGLAHVLEDH